VFEDSMCCSLCQPGRPCPEVAQLAFKLLNRRRKLIAFVAAPHYANKGRLSSARSRACCSARWIGQHVYSSSRIFTHFAMTCLLDCLLVLYELEMLSSCEISV